MNLESNSEYLYVDFPKDSEVTTNSTKKKILDFKNLEKGWCYGEGELFEDHVIRKSVELHKEAINQGFLETDAFPGTNGEIRITIYLDEDYFEFTLDSNEKLAFVHEKGNEEILSEESLSLEKAKKKIRDIRDIRKEKCIIFDSFIKNFTIQDFKDSKVWLSGTQVPTEVYLLSATSAYYNRIQFASIQNSTTR